GLDEVDTEVAVRDEALSGARALRAAVRGEALLLRADRAAQLDRHLDGAGAGAIHHDHDRTAGWLPGAREAHGRDGRGKIPAEAAGQLPARHLARQLDRGRLAGNQERDLLVRGRSK